MASRKACKRKTDDDDETWSPSAKRGRGKKSTAGAAAAAGCGGGIGLWIIWCTRKAQVIEMDEDSYIGWSSAWFILSCWCSSNRGAVSGGNAADELRR
jgi:hypothetical protein